MPNINIDNIVEDHNSQHLLHFVPPPLDDGDKPGNELVPPAMASESQLLAPTLPPPVLRNPARFVVPSVHVASKHQLSAPALVDPIPHDPAPFKLLPAAEILSIPKPSKMVTLQHAKASAAPTLCDTAAPQKQLCFESPPPNETASARKPIMYNWSHEEKIKSLKAQLVALQADHEHDVDDASSSYEYKIVDVSMNNPNGNDNEGLPEIRLHTSKDKHK